MEHISAWEHSLDAGRGNMNLPGLFDALARLCAVAGKPVVLIVDEVDSASNNQVFLDFLSQLRVQYLSRKRYPAFWSVILAGVYDIRNLKQKIRPDGQHKYNSPWNIAADFNVDMSFSIQDIAGMLERYEQDYHTGMDIGKIAKLIYEYIRRDEEDQVEEVNRAIDGLDLDIQEGDFVAILGHNGSGKSTFAKQLNGILLPTEGTVWISGMKTDDDSHIWDIRKTAGMVFQNPDNQIIGNVVEEDVGFGPENLDKKMVYMADEKL